MELLKKKRGFTLIELMVVVAIIIILAGLVILNVSQSRVKARDSKRISDLRSIQGALEMYFEKNRTYPVPDVSGLATGYGYSNTVADCWTDKNHNWIPDGAASNNTVEYKAEAQGGTASNWSNQYISGVQPHDPSENCSWPYGNHIYNLGDPSTYEYWSNGLRYVLAVRLQDTNSAEINGDKVMDPRSTNADLYGGTTLHTYAETWKQYGMNGGGDKDEGKYSFVITN